jgi:hypothetical protein
MAVNDSVDPGAWLARQIEAGDPDLLRSMVKTMAEALMSAEADTVCGADYGQRSTERTNSRNGYRTREWDTRAGTVELAIPKLRQGSYFPDWLLERRRRAEQALVSVVATSYLLGVSTRRVDKLVEQLGITGISKSQVSQMAKSLDVQVEAFRTRALDGGPYSFVWLDALTQKVREGGRIVNVHALVATAVNANGNREILGLDISSREDGAGWLAFLRGLVARGLSGVQLVISDAHAGLVEAIGSTLPGASWQRCRTHCGRQEIRSCFLILGSLEWYGDLQRGPWAARAEIHGVIATSERASAAVDVGGRGAAAWAWRCSSRRPGSRGQRDNGPLGHLRTGGRPGSMAGGSYPAAGRGPQACDRTPSGTVAGAAGAGRAG